jgi:predicted amidohydrolase
MNTSTLRVALVTELYHDDPDNERLCARLTEARSAGAELAVLPELPLDPWVPATRKADPADAEDPRGRRHRALARAARESGVGVLGGAIVRDPETGARHNTALIFDGSGACLASYRKVHLPFEKDFWEAAHYEPGATPPEVVGGFALPIGIQICSDANRTSGCQLLAAQGAGVIFVPRATPAASWQRWRLVLRADAVTAACWVVTVNRPSTGAGSPVGGPSAVIAPGGEVVCETTNAVAVVELDGESVAAARTGYPGYLEFRPEVYRKGWADVVARRRR